jgi:hypothetical protein
MAIAFPLSTYPLSDRTQINDEHTVARDVLDDGTMRIRVLGDSTFRTVRCVFNYLTESESSTFEQYLITNRATEFTMVLDSQSPTTTYQGYIWSNPSVSVRDGNLYTWQFDFRGKVV